MILLSRTVAIVYLQETATIWCREVIDSVVVSEHHTTPPVDSQYVLHQINGRLYLMWQNPNYSYKLFQVYHAAPLRFMWLTLLVWLIVQNGGNTHMHHHICCTMDHSWYCNTLQAGRNPWIDMGTEHVRAQRHFFWWTLTCLYHVVIVRSRNCPLNSCTCQALLAA